MYNIRPAVFAGQFYSDSENELRKEIKEYISKAKTKNITSTPRGLIVPHAGYQYSGIVAASGYNYLDKSKLKPNEIIIIGPSHRIMFQNLALSSFSIWQTPLGNVQTSNLFKELSQNRNFNILNEAHTFEHSIEVQLPFLQTILKDFKITPIATGRIENPKEIATEINKHLTSEKLILVSSDLSHYLPYKHACKIDKQTIKKIIDLDADIDPESACGASGIQILIELAKMNNWKAELLDYRNSGDTTSLYDKSLTKMEYKGQVVGYTSVVFS